MNTGQLTLDDYIINEITLYENMSQGFDEVLNKTIEWVQSPEAEEFFITRRGKLSTFMTESGIRDDWNTIIQNRAQRGSDLTEEIYDYARRKNMTEYLTEYTPSERLAMNRLCDYNYELIVNVTQDQIAGIRRSLIQDYAEGVNPRQTSMREALEAIQLQPINGLSPEERAVMIARTESARTLNVSTLTTYQADGYTHVELYGTGQCDDCASIGVVTVEEALNIEVPHPNCRCAWIPANKPESN
jgi:hypothetical protein